MILICGTNKQKSELPNSDLVEYIVTTPSDINIKVKTQGRRSDLIKAYISNSIDNIDFSGISSDKKVYFNTDEELCLLLEGKSLKEEEVYELKEESVVATEKVQESDTHTPKNDTTTLIQDTNLLNNESKNIQIETSSLNSDFGINVIPTVEVVESNFETLDSLWITPGIGEDVDSLKLQLEDKEKLLTVKQGIIDELNNSKDELIQLHNKTLEDMAIVHKEKVEEANNSIRLLKDRLVEAKLPDSKLEFLKYMAYAEKSKAMSNEGYKGITDLKDIHILASGGGSSLYDCLEGLTQYIAKGEKLCIVDFSSTNYLRFKYKLKGVNSTLDIIDGKPLKEVGYPIMDSVVYPSSIYNDITLLTVDWVKILSNLKAEYPSRKIIVLFPSISSFAIRHTVSKLGTICDLRIVARCNPIQLITLNSELSHIPTGRYGLIATHNIEAVQPILEDMKSKTKIDLYNGEVQFDKLRW